MEYFNTWGYHKVSIKDECVLMLPRTFFKSRRIYILLGKFSKETYYKMHFFKNSGRNKV